MCNKLFQKLCLLGKGLVHSGSLTGLCHTTFQNFQIGENQFQIDGFNITERINASVNVYHIRILKAAYHMHNRIHFTDVA